MRISFSFLYSLSLQDAIGYVVPTQPFLPKEESTARGRRMSVKAQARLERVAFKTSRLLDFVGQRELVAQTGHAVAEWPLMML
jgi:hypothetical protein